MTDIFKTLLTKIFSAQMRKIIAKHNPKIIGVVGSVGKTTTKIAIATVLSEAYKVQAQAGSYNTPISMPFVFTGLQMPSLYNPFSWISTWMQGQKILKGPKPYDIVVVELGTDTPGDIIAYKNVLHCDIAVITAISEEHMQHFSDLRAVAAEELSVTGFCEQLLISSDDINPLYLQEFGPKGGKVVHSYGFGSLEHKISAIRNNELTFNVAVSLKGDEQLRAKVDLVARHNLGSVAAAVAVANLLGLDKNQIISGVSKIKPLGGRMQLLQGINYSTILDDSYSSDPLATKAALETLYEINAPQKIAVLGSMNELGKFSEMSHKQMGNLCTPDKLDLLITVGEEADKFLAEAAIAKGCKVVRCGSPYEAGNILAVEIKQKALVLVKGSQNGIFTEEAIKPVLFNKLDEKLLVRQSQFWLDKKRKQFVGEKTKSE